MPLPRDFLDEIETELRSARCALTRNHERIAALEDLRLLAVSVATRLNRPVTVFDVVRATVDQAERERRARLVRKLRRPKDP
jgi:hypothetical protein